MIPRALNFCDNPVSGAACESELQDQIDQNTNNISQNQSDIQENQASIATLVQQLANIDFSEIKNFLLIVDEDPVFRDSQGNNINQDIIIWYNRTQEKLKVRDDCQIYAVTLTLDADWCYYYQAS